jgi:hypothetical protein
VWKESAAMTVRFLDWIATLKAEGGSAHAHICETTHREVDGDISTRKR